jgi:hypothetical protein
MYNLSNGVCLEISRGMPNKEKELKKNQKIAGSIL